MTLPTAASSTPSATLPGQFPERRDPAPWISLLLAIGLLIVIYGVLIMIGTSWSGSASDLDTVLGLYQFGVMFVVTLLAVPGLNPDRRGCLRYVGIFILSVIPIIGWLVVYWAGKGIARSLAGRRS